MGHRRPILPPITRKSASGYGPLYCICLFMIKAGALSNACWDEQRILRVVKLGLGYDSNLIKLTRLVEAEDHLFAEGLAQTTPVKEGRGLV